MTTGVTRSPGPVFAKVVAAGVEDATPDVSSTTWPREEGVVVDEPLGVLVLEVPEELCPEVFVPFDCPAD